MAKKKRNTAKNGSTGVQSPHAILAPAVREAKHGLYRNLAKLDGRTRPALIRNGLKRALLERFPQPVPAIAQVIAERCAIKLIRAASFEGFILAGKEIPAVNADRDYLALTASIRADIQTLFLMAKEGGTTEKVPSLAEYLEAIKSGKIIPVEAKE